MVNKNILETRLLNKFRNLTLHSIVNECFLRGLPLTKSALTNSDMVSLSKYSLTVLESVGGYNIASESLKNLNDVKQNAFLKNILNTCNTAAIEATKRIALETDCKNPKTSIDEVVDKAAFTDAEYNKFKSMANNIDAEEIGKIINEKTIAIIKSEKEIQEYDEVLKQELADALADSKDFSEVSNESYMDIVLGMDAARTPISFFSKVFEAAYENILHTKEEYKEIPFKTLNRITFESTLNVFKKDKTPMQCLESILDVNYAPAVPNTEDRQKLTDTSMVCTIIIYTVLEVLRTLHIYSPTQQDIEKFMKNTVSCKDMIAKDRDSFIANCNSNIDDIRRYCLTNNNPQDLSNARNQLIILKDKLVSDECYELDFLNAKSEIMTSIDSLVTTVTSKLNTIEENSNIKKEFTSFEKHAMESDIAGMNKINGLFGNKDNISEICIMLNPAHESIQYLDVACKDAAGHTIEKSFIPINFKAKNNETYVKESFGQSKLHNCKKPVYLCYSDGTGKKFKLN